MYLIVMAIVYLALAALLLIEAAVGFRQHRTLWRLDSARISDFRWYAASAVVVAVAAVLYALSALGVASYLQLIGSLVFLLGLGGQYRSRAGVGVVA